MATRASDENLATEVLDDFRRIVQVLRCSSRAAEQQFGLSGAQLFVLKTLSAGSPLSLNELAEHTRTHQSTVSVVVKRLVASGLVRSVVSTNDRRRVALSPTASGLARMKRVPMAAQQQLVDGVKRMPLDDRRALARCMRRLVRTMRMDEAPAEMFSENRSVASRKA